MTNQYSHLCVTERVYIEVFHRTGASCKAIGDYLGRSRTTVWRECRRGWWAAMGRYSAEFGLRHYARCRRDAGRQRRKLGDDLSSPAWRHVVLGLQLDWSPQQIAGRLRA